MRKGKVEGAITLKMKRHNFYLFIYLIFFYLCVCVCRCIYFGEGILTLISILAPKLNIIHYLYMAGK
jgi:hypothetical protein